MYNYHSDAPKRQHKENNMTTKTAYIVTPKSQIHNFINASDREYFSKPVLVEIVGKTETGLLMVTDHRRGHTYPCLKTCLKSKYHLTHKQLAASA